jgi:cation diffusion facilitator family transporter
VAETAPTDAEGAAAPEGPHEESTGTVLLALVANLGIAVAKLVGGLVSGSAAMLAEAAHSVADTLNQVLLLTGLRRSRRPADEDHPFGYGQERYFWSLLAAVGIFVLGAGYSVYEGVHAIREPEELGSLVVPYAVLGLAFLLEGASWLKAIRQLHGEARQQERSMRQQLRLSADPTVKTVAFEDSAALIGIVLAAAGIGLHELTGQGYWDGAASIAIGGLLIVVAYELGRQNMRALVGLSVPSELRRSIRTVIADSPGVDSVVDVRTMQLGPGDILVAARIDVDDDATGGDVEEAASAVEQRLRERHPEVRHVFLDPTDADDDRE